MYSLFSVIDSLKFLISYLLNIEVYVHGYIVCLQDVLLGEMTSHEQRSWCYKSLTQVPFIVRTTKFQCAVQVFMPTSESARQRGVKRVVKCTEAKSTAAAVQRCAVPFVLGAAVSPTVAFISSLQMLCFLKPELSLLLLLYENSFDL